MRSGSRLRQTVWFLIILLIPVLSAGSPVTANADTIEPYVGLYGQKTDVLVGEEVILILSAVNPITSPDQLVVQLTLRIPSSWSLASADFCYAVGGLPTAVYQIRKGTAQHISVQLLANEPYQGEILGYIDYYFDTDEQEKRHRQLNLPVTVRREVPKQEAIAGSPARQGTLWIIVGVILGIISAAGYVVRRRAHY